MHFLLSFTAQEVTCLFLVPLWGWQAAIFLGYKSHREMKVCVSLLVVCQQSPNKLKAEQG